MSPEAIPKIVLIIVMKDKKVFLVEVYHPEDLKVKEEVWLTTMNHFGTYSILGLERNFEHSDNVTKMVRAQRWSTSYLCGELEHK